MILHNKPSFSKKSEIYVHKVLTSGRLVDGSFIEKFENKICEYLGLPDKHAVAVSSGSAALYICLQLLDAKNKQVAIPSYACSSLIQACRLVNSRVKVIDIKKGFPAICPQSLNKSKSDILIYPYLFGLASQLPKFSGDIIEDCAQALGASISGKKLGTQTEFGVLSFYATKLLTSGGHGGMIVSKNKAVADAVKNFIQFDRQRDQKFRFNFFMTEIQAAVGFAQLESFPDFLNKREDIWQHYQHCNFNLLDNADAKNVRFRAVLKTTKPVELIKHLEKYKINAIVPIEKWELIDPSCKNSCELALNTVSLPIYPELEQVEFIAEKVKEFI